jgi:hypothetical protein
MGTGFLTVLYHTMRRWVGHVAQITETKNTYKSFIRRPKENNHSEDLDKDGRIK